MLAIRTLLRWSVAALLGFTLLQGGRARAANFEVSPIRVPLSQATPNGLLTVRNQSSEPLRFQVTAFAWAQGPDGEMQLTPTDEIVVFPTMFSLKPGEARNMRVGSLAPLGGVEKTYRIFVEELPPTRASTAPPGVIRVLTRMGIPIFQSPSGAAAAPRIEGLAVQFNELVFGLRNQGNAFFFARHVRVTGVAKDGHTVFTREVPGWYVLAGGTRAYALDLPPEACGAARLQVDVETEATVIHASVEMPPRACAR